MPRLAAVALVPTLGGSHFLMRPLMDSRVEHVVETCNLRQRVVPISAAVAIALLVGGTLRAQTPAPTRPNFSGSWAYDTSSEKPEPAVRRPGQVDFRPHSVAAGFGLRFEAHQDARLLTVTRLLASGKTMETTYDLSGGSTKNQEGPMVTTSVAHWEKEKLVIVSSNDTPPFQGDTKRTIWLEGYDTLKIETDGSARPASETGTYRRVIHAG
jgi:hypothetical protein